MKITEEHKSILQIFKTMADTKSELGDKIEIKIDNGIISFKQLGHYATLLYEAGIESNENFKIVYPVDAFFSLIKTVKDKEVDVSDKGIKIGGGDYQFDSSTITVPDIKSRLNQLKQDIQEKIVIEDFEGINICRGFLGGTYDDLETVALMNNHWISSDKIACALIQTSNNVRSDFYLPKTLVNLFAGNPVEKLEIDIHSDFWSFLFRGIQFVIPKRKYGLPNFFDESFMKTYNHPKFAEVKTSEMIRILQLMRIVVSQNPNNRIYIKFNEESLTIRNKDKNLSEDSVNAVVDPDLVSRECCISCSYLLNLLSVVDTDNARLFICKDADDSQRNRTVRIENTTSTIKLISVFTV